ncbi:cyclic pyranopterin monophosphate synthase MoaC [Planctomicrobium sp. SH668]|uniref:cyclic pyranopterin monophosphate synthase MoaC n=1 Tax=Planctomicrobium sp. SH668 TaxID=3448126 RepID=UPI003F5C4CA4
MSQDVALTHFDASGAARMVSVVEKPVTARMARAQATVQMQPATLQRILQRQLSKGDVCEIARLAGIMATKRTAELIPLCHPISLDGVEVSITPAGETLLIIESCVRTDAKTGVEMEALTSVTVAALTIYDMCKSIDRGMKILETKLIEKLGGKSGHFIREVENENAV